ncbi:hypothetical protein [Streptomyces sp. NBC_01750]|uniref:hypothetical protein n=1 Tax=Streptomyces sp. NBC_01750 TaxID=2975928 RepID=UPI002DDACD2F|nr:hypothetical protein [Streptomyces sp. NBC_01750]WSD33884.1 serine/threonine-protein phosphatase [Streptomyces sp. NBC_01750]
MARTLELPGSGVHACSGRGTPSSGCPSSLPPASPSRHQKPRRTAVPSNRPQFGEDALAAAFAGCHDLDASGIITRLGEILAEHRGAWAGDDTALLALRVPPRP